jgi:arylsulfatase A-like enzyme
MLHTTTLYEEMIHVPLVIRLPPRFGQLPSRYDGIVELRDVLPTLCEAMRVPCAVPAGRSCSARCTRARPTLASRDRGPATPMRSRSARS